MGNSTSPPPVGSVVGTITSRAQWNRCVSQPGLTRPADYIELRIDSMMDKGRPPTFRPLDKPVLLTVRHPSEGGDGNLSLSKRRSLYRSFLPHANLVDLEIRSLPRFTSEVQLARDLEVILVASYHHFKHTPSPVFLRDKVQQGFDLGAAVVKIATYLENPRDLIRLANLFERFSDAPLSLMGMGPLGPASRVLLSRLGSRLNYGFLESPNAPGQPSAHSLRIFREETAYND